MTGGQSDNISGAALDAAMRPAWRGDMLPVPALFAGPARLPER